jgi:hypothetical protein
VRASASPHPQGLSASAGGRTLPDRSDTRCNRADCKIPPLDSYNWRGSLHSQSSKTATIAVLATASSIENPWEPCSLLLHFPYEIYCGRFQEILDPNSMFNYPTIWLPNIYFSAFLFRGSCTFHTWDKVEWPSSGLANKWDREGDHSRPLALEQPASFPGYLRHLPLECLG